MLHTHHRIALSLALALLVSACSRTAPDTTEVIRPVRVLELQASQAHAEESYPAQIEARVQSMLSFQVGGRVIERKVEVGQTVTKGQVLARIDPKDLQLGLQAAQAQLDAAQADLAQTKTDFDRAKTLRDKGFVSQAELDRRQLALDAAQGRVTQAQAQQAVQRNQGQYSQLTAPQDGVITQVLADVGQTMAPGQPVVQWAQPQSIQVRLAIPETRVAQYPVGRTAQVKLWTVDTPLSARIREVSPVADPVTRAYVVKLDITDPQRLARLGMSATAYFSREVTQSAFRLPMTALVASHTGAYVWVFDEKAGVVNQRPVKPFDITASDFLVKEGLKPGELVVTAGTHVLNEGQKAKRFIEAKDLQAKAKVQP